MVMVTTHNRPAWHDEFQTLRGEMSQFEAQLQRGLWAEQVQRPKSDVPRPAPGYAARGPEPLTLREVVKLTESL